MSRSYLVTGGTGFLGSALVRRMVHAGFQVRVLDNNSRGSAARLQDVIESIEYIEGDIRDPSAVERAAKGVEGICHLAFVNGTEFFYTRPELVLDVGVRGIINVLDACRKHHVRDLVLASSSEVYQTPPVIPTGEDVPLSIPDPLNPRYSYGAGKIISEIMALNYGRTDFDRVVVFRPHNVYGPDMGWEHVLPQFVLRMKELCQEAPGQADGPVRFPIQGSGKETRAFVFVDDFIDGVMLVLEHGQHLNIYNIGTMEEVSMEETARAVGEYFNRQVEVIPGEPAKGGTMRRCPDIEKLAALGYSPRRTLREGVPLLARWYDENAHLAPARNTGR